MRQHGIKRHTLWIGFAAALVPLALLLALQYRWLVKLDHTSAQAHQATLANYLEAVVAEVKTTYQGKAERALNLPASTFTPERLEKAAHHFKKKQVEGARRFFVLLPPQAEGEHTLLRYYDPETASLVEPEWSPEARAIWVAAAPWLTLAKKGGTIETVAASVDERDPENRVLLAPVTDDASRLVGVAGMILDDEYLAKSLLPNAIQRSLPRFFAGQRELDPVVWVRDHDRHAVYSTAEPGCALSEYPPEVKTSFAFVFSDWEIGLSSRHATPGQVARRNFLVNIALSAALSAALIGGILLALRTASREMKLSQMKNDFVSNVSHELRTPLASIRVFGELLRLGRVGSPEKIREYGDYIETESRRLTQLINNLLDFASIESGRKSYRFERADLEEVVTETLKTFGVRLRQNGFRITYHGPATPLPQLRFDAAAVAQSLSNLLDNAVKYSNGNREIDVYLRRQGNLAEIAVQDRGIGIPRDEQKKIFDRFHRVGTGLVHDVKGSGLGLAIVRHILEAHGGSVAVESRPDEGSTFSLLLPIDPAA
ncbi:MAG TPA: HAMP domain-containing sensor histidine kinase, partial [Thermoanaerobaculia bacterium]|nr:HAMP domain-containing sensor histidine kinase [Thermoanaerobaculia bacterium]